MQIELVAQTSWTPHQTLLNRVCTGNVQGSLEYIVISDTKPTTTGFEMNGLIKDTINTKSEDQTLSKPAQCNFGHLNI